MAEPGDDCMILDSGLALSETYHETGEDAVLYREATSRGESVPQVGDDVALVTSSVAQSNSGGIGGIALEDLKATDQLMYSGDTTTLSIRVVNNTEQAVDYQLDFKEDGSVISSQTKTIESRGHAEYSVDVTKSGAGEFTYQANGSNELTLTWLHTRPGPLESTPETVYLDRDETTSTLSIDIENPGTQDQTVQVRFLNGTTVVGQTEKSIAAGTTESYSTDVSNTETATKVYTAQVVEPEFGLAGKSNPETVRWLTSDKDFASMPSDLPSLTFSDGSDTGTVEPGGGGDKRTKLRSNTETSMSAWFEDFNDYDWNDCLCSYDWENWESNGYVNISVTHGESGGAHTITVGSFSDSHDSTNDTLAFDLLFYEDGIVTDGGGNEVGTWK